MHKLAEIILPQSSFSLSQQPAQTATLSPEDRECMKLVSFLREKTLTEDFPYVWFKVPNEFDGRKNPVFGRRMERLGRVKGAPDYVIAGKGNVMFVEMKSKRGRLSSAQKLFQEWCNACNVEYVLASDGNEVIERLM